MSFPRTHETLKHPPTNHQAPAKKGCLLLPPHSPSRYTRDWNQQAQKAVNPLLSLLVSPKHSSPHHFKAPCQALEAWLFRNTRAMFGHVPEGAQKQPEFRF